MKIKSSKKIKLLFVFGTRPEALKLAPLILAAKKGTRFQTSVCLTAQHRQMADQVLKLFSIRPDFDLDLMSTNQSLGELTSKVFAGIERVIGKVKPDLILVQGDTTTAFTVALKSFYEKIPVAHIEAGLRSHNKYHPFPEEINRVLISHVADYHFAPTAEAQQNLLKEGVRAQNIFVTGNTVVDALNLIAGPNKNAVHSNGRKLILVTAHRRESFGAPLKRICLALKEIVKKFPEVDVLYPVHLNPKVQSVVKRELSGSERIKLIEPVSYEKFVGLMKKSHLILTDSGGIQEEAPSLGKPVLVMRETTERPDGVRSGLAKLVGTSQKKIVQETSRLLKNVEAYERMTRGKNPYGDGRASKRILNIIASRLAK